MKVAVVAHSGKTLGGGLPELRRALAADGIDAPFWCEVPKSRAAPEQVRRALKEGADLVFASTANASLSWPEPASTPR